MKVLQGLSLLLIIISSCKSSVDKPPTLPSFGIKLVNQEGVFNTSQLDNNKPVILMYVNPDCQYCQAQMSTFLGHIDEFKNVSFCIVSDFPAYKLDAFTNKYNLKNYPNIIVGHDTARFFVQNFKPTGTPYIAIYNRQGFLKYVFPGVGSYEDINQALSKI